MLCSDIQAQMNPTTATPIPCAPEGDEAAHEACKALLIPGHLLPVHPVEGAVMAVGVVVAGLAVPVFVTHLEHGDAVGQQQRTRSVAHLALPQPAQRDSTAVQHTSANNSKQQQSSANNSNDMC